jgi:hypothetical protein
VTGFDASAPSASELLRLAGAPAELTELENALIQARTLLAIVAEVWAIPAADVPPAATFSAAWDSDLV